MNILLWQEQTLIPASHGRAKPHIYHVVDARYSPKGAFGFGREGKVPATKEDRGVGY